MSFSSDVKNELAQVKDAKSCCQLSELGGLYGTMGSLSLLGRGRVNAQLSSESMAVCRRAYTLLQSALGLSPQIHYVSSARFGGTRKAVLTLGPLQSPALLRALRMMGEDGTLRATSPRLSLTRGCCARAFLRGVMLGGGTMSSPEQGYHLELACRSQDMQALTAKCMQRVGLPVHLSARRDHIYLYLKQSEQVVTFLTAIGAHSSVMQIEDLRVRRQVMGAVNRAMNCDSANLQKQMDASSAQVRAIRRLRDEGVLATLPPSLQAMAMARLDAPEASLEQLGQQLNPPIGKSGANHRMRRLMNYAQELKEDEP